MDDHSTHDGAITSVADAKACLATPPGERTHSVDRAIRLLVREGGRHEKEIEGADLSHVRLDYETVVGADVHPLTFRGCTIGEVSIVGANVDIPIQFHECDIERVDLSATRFDHDVSFRDSRLGETMLHETRFRQDADFTGVEFVGSVDADEATFGDDVAFVGTTFTDTVSMRATVFTGTSNEIGDNAAFTDATFADAASFDRASFECATFEGVYFHGDVSFHEATASDELLYTGATFDAAAKFRAVQFRGVVSFDDAVFRGTVRFDAADLGHDGPDVATDASFRDVQFPATASFVGVRFSSVVCVPRTSNETVYLDWSRATIERGTVQFPADDTLRVDVTRASVGAVSFQAETDRDVLASVRFCDTEFDEFDDGCFDFAAHAASLKRNGWRLHEFDDPTDRTYELAMTPDNIERTYLKAKIAASNAGFVEAAAEFRLRRQRWARRTNLDIFRSGRNGVFVRLKSLVRVAENVFLDVTCGYGVRLGRIITVFAVVPLVPALLFVFGGGLFETGAGQLASPLMLASPDGQTVLGDAVYFSYVTYLSIGYGTIRPIGTLARAVAATEVYLSVVLGGLVVYSLVKRSEL